MARKTWRALRDGLIDMSDRIDLQAFPSPCYVLEENQLLRNLEILHSLSKSCGISVLLALKGFACWKFFPLIAQYLQGASVSSLHEARLACTRMKLPIHSYAVAYNSADFSKWLPYTKYLTFNSLTSFRTYHEEALHKNISCGLRINPQHSEAPSALYDPCSKGSRLGIVRSALSTLPKHVEGLHVHALCENDSYAFERLLQAIEEHWSPFLEKIHWLNLGGGYLFTDESFSTVHFKQIIHSFRKKYPQINIFFEVGSAVAWKTGGLKVKILDVVENSHVRTAIIDASFTCHMPDCLEMPYRPSIQGASLDPQKYNFTYRIGGLSCLAGDFLDAYSFRHPLRIGDTLYFEDMMHYTMVKTTHFNGINHPSIASWHPTKGATLLKTFGYKEYASKLA